MKKIAIYGAGGFGKEVACLIDRINAKGGDWELIGFFDDTKPAGTPVSIYGKVLGGMDAIRDITEPMALAIAINENKVVKRITETITNDNVYFPNLIDPSLFVVDKRTLKMGEGNIIQNDCMISCDVSIGSFNLINDHVVVGHDNVIGNFNGLMPGAHLSGSVTIGDNNLLGVASAVVQGITIGNGITLGANSVLMTQPRDNKTYLGVPAKRFGF